MKYLAVDFGASSGRTILGTIADGLVFIEGTPIFPKRIKEVGGMFKDIARSLPSTAFEPRG